MAFACIGLGIFLISIRVMSCALQDAAGTRLRAFLSTLTTNSFTGMVTGVVATTGVQSSSAVAAAMVALVNSRLLSLEQAFGVILGANIGTTVTAQIASLKLDALAPVLIVMGLTVAVLGRTRRAGKLGIAVFSLGSLFLGMYLLRQGLRPLAALPFFRLTLANLARNNFFGVLAGIFATAIVQSSSAVTGVTIALAGEGLISLPIAIALALGSNIGTVATTLIASIGTSPEARRTALADLVFNIVGVALVFPFLPAFVELVALTGTAVERQVANAHTLFNIVTAAATLPLIRPLAALLRRIVPDGIMYSGNRRGPLGK